MRLDMNAFCFFLRNVELIMLFWFFSDRFRTTSNILDDCFAAAVIEKLSKKDLLEMDQETNNQLPENEKLLETVSL